MNLKIENKKGFTLMEVIVALAIIATIITFVAPKLLTLADKAKVDKAKSDIRAISSALKMYYLDNGFYPTTEQGLISLIKKPEIDPIPNSWAPGGYLDLEEAPRDPWGNLYIYRSPGEVKDFDLISYGADRREGGSGYAADIRN